MDSEQFRKAAASTIDEIISYNDSIAERPVVSQVQPGYLAKLLPTSAPEEGEAWQAIQADIEAKIQPGLTHWQSPRYMAWFPAAVTYPSMLGEMFSAAFTSANFNWICSPAVTELETVVMDWVARLLHLPDVFLSHGTGGGCIQGTASEAVVACIAAARERYCERKTAHLRDGSDEKEDAMARLRGRMVALSSEQAHSCTLKGAKIAGVRYRGIKTHFGDDMALTGAGLREALEECKAKGLEPFYLTVCLGTTGTCAVDRFEEIAAVMAEYPDVWVHVDAAYAGVALALPEYAARYGAATMARFDSFEVNMHKWGLVNLDAACLFVQRRRDLTDAFTTSPSYLRNDLADRRLVNDYRDWGIPLGRRFRSLKVWFVLRTYGVRGFRDLIRGHLAMADEFASLVRSRPDLLRILTPPAFALTVVTCVPPGKGNGKPRQEGSSITENAETEGFTNDEKLTAHVDDDKGLQEANELTKEVYELINNRGEIFLTSAIVNDVYAIRVVSSNPKAEMKYLKRAFELLTTTTEEVIAKKAQGKTA